MRVKGRHSKLPVSMGGKEPTSLMTQLGKDTSDTSEKATAKDAQIKKLQDAFPYTVVPEVKKDDKKPTPPSTKATNSKVPGKLKPEKKKEPKVTAKTKTPPAAKADAPCCCSPSIPVLRFLNRTSAPPTGGTPPLQKFNPETEFAKIKGNRNFDALTYIRGLNNDQAYGGPSVTANQDSALVRPTSKTF